MYVLCPAEPLCEFISEDDLKPKAETGENWTAPHIPEGRMWGAYGNQGLEGKRKEPLGWHEAETHDRQPVKIPSGGEDLKTELIVFSSKLSVLCYF